MFRDIFSSQRKKEIPNPSHLQFGKVGKIDAHHLSTNISSFLDTSQLHYILVRNVASTPAIIFPFENHHPRLFSPPPQTIIFPTAPAFLQHTTLILIVKNLLLLKMHEELKVWSVIIEVIQKHENKNLVASSWFALSFLLRWYETDVCLFGLKLLFLSPSSSAMFFGYG